MNVRSCLRCKRIFNAVSSENICPLCKKNLDDILKEVKKYVRDNRGVSATEISEMFEVSMKVVLEWVRTDELEIVEGVAKNMLYKSEKQKIFNDISTSLKESIKEPEKEDVRMRFVDTARNNKDKKRF